MKKITIVSVEDHDGNAVDATLLESDLDIYEGLLDWDGREQALVDIVAAGIVECTSAIRGESNDSLAGRLIIARTDAHDWLPDLSLVEAKIVD